jgi:non-ribosomal peptide synthetase component F
MPLHLRSLPITTMAVGGARRCLNRILPLRRIVLTCWEQKFRSASSGTVDERLRQAARLMRALALPCDAKPAVRLARLRNRPPPWNKANP